MLPFHTILLDFSGMWTRKKLNPFIKSLLAFINLTQCLLFYRWGFLKFAEKHNNKKKISSVSEYCETSENPIHSTVKIFDGIQSKEGLSWFGTRNCAFMIFLGKRTSKR